MYDAPEELIRDVVNTLGWPPVAAKHFVYGLLRTHFGHPLADTVATMLHDEWVDTTWPACPIHKTHPMVVTVEDDFETWRCPTDRRVVARVGELPAKETA